MIQALEAPAHPAASFSASKQTPAEQVRILLIVKRRQGVSFEQAWAYAWKCIRWPHDREHRHEWKDAIEWSQPIFHNAYYKTREDPVDKAMSGLEAAA